MATSWIWPAGSWFADLCSRLRDHYTLLTHSTQLCDSKKTGAAKSYSITGWYHINLLIPWEKISALLERHVSVHTPNNILKGLQNRRPFLLKTVSEINQTFSYLAIFPLMSLKKI